MAVLNKIPRPLLSGLEGSSVASCLLINYITGHVTAMNEHWQYGLYFAHYFSGIMPFAIIAEKLRGYPWFRYVSLILGLMYILSFFGGRGAGSTFDSLAPKAVSMHGAPPELPKPIFLNPSKNSHPVREMDEAAARLKRAEEEEAKAEERREAKAEADREKRLRKQQRMMVILNNGMVCTGNGICTATMGNVTMISGNIMFTAQGGTQSYSQTVTTPEAAAFVKREAAHMNSSPKMEAPKCVATCTGCHEEQQENTTWVTYVEDKYCEGNHEDDDYGTMGWAKMKEMLIPTMWPAVNKTTSHSFSKVDDAKNITEAH